MVSKNKAKQNKLTNKKTATEIINHDVTVPDVSYMWILPDKIKEMSLFILFHILIPPIKDSQATVSNTFLSAALHGIESSM